MILAQGMDSDPAVRSVVAWASLMLTAAVATGCDQSSPPRPEASSGLDWSSAEVTEVDSWPPLRQVTEGRSLFAADSLAPPLFRVTDVMPRREGGVYVANAGNSEILAIQRDGTVAWRAGGEGEGPAEFGSLGTFQAWPGDTLVAFDRARNKATFWNAEGEHLRTWSAGATSPEPKPNLLFMVNGAVVGALDDGRLIIRGPEHVYGRDRPGLRRTRTSMTVVDRSGESRVPYVLPGPWVYELQDPPGRRQALPAPMSGATAVDVPGHLLEVDVVWARADSFEVVLLDTGGTVRHVLRVDEPRRKTTPMIEADFREDWSPWFEVNEEIPFPRRVPAYDEVFVSRNGYVWARRYHWGESGEEWIRHVDGSENIARYHFPPRVQIMGANDERAFGIRRDTLDVQHLVSFELPSS